MFPVYNLGIQIALPLNIKQDFEIETCQDSLLLLKLLFHYWYFNKLWPQGFGFFIKEVKKAFCLEIVAHVTGDRKEQEGANGGIIRSWTCYIKPLMT